MKNNACWTVPFIQCEHYLEHFYSAYEEKLDRNDNHAKKISYAIYVHKQQKETLTTLSGKLQEGKKSHLSC